MQVLTHHSLLFSYVSLTISVFELSGMKTQQSLLNQKQPCSDLVHQQCTTVVSMGPNKRRTGFLIPPLLCADLVFTVCYNLEFPIFLFHFELFTELTTCFPATALSAIASRLKIFLLDHVNKWMKCGCFYGGNVNGK